MKYAVIRSGGKQYRVREGDVLDVDKLSSNGQNAVFEDVLLMVHDSTVEVGTPLLSGVRVNARVIGDIKGEKLRVAKFKAKSRYRRVLGFRPRLTRVQIETIESAKSALGKPAKTTRKTVAKETRAISAKLTAKKSQNKKKT